jgi:hypothetical protein
MEEKEGMMEKKMCKTIKVDGTPCYNEAILDGKCLVHYINEEKKNKKKNTTQ